MDDKELMTKVVRGRLSLGWADLLCILLIVGLGGLVLRWFADKPHLAAGDFGMLTSREDYFLQAFFGWDGNQSTGVPTPRHVATLVPVGLYAWLTEYLGLSLEFFLKSLLSILFVCSGLSMYYLCLSLGIKQPGRLVAALFYMMNPFSLIIIWKVAHGFVQLPYAFAPLVFGMYIRGLEGKRGVVATAAGICLCWFIATTSAYTYPPAAVMHWVPIAGYFIFFLILNINHRDKRNRLLRFTFCLLGLWCLVNSFWIIPLILSLTVQFELARNPSFAPDIKLFSLTSSKLLDAIRFMGYWALHEEHMGDFFYEYHEHFFSSIVNWISFLIPMIAFYPFVRKGPKDPRQLFLLCFVLAGLFLIKGPNPPLGGVLSWLYESFPSFATAFRFLFFEYGVPTYLAYSALLGFGINCLYSVLDRRWGGYCAGGFVATILFLLIVVLVFPFWNGTVVLGGGMAIPPERNRVPQYYNDMKSWTASETEEHRIFVLPMSKNYNSFLVWERDEETGQIINGYAGGYIDRWFSEKPIIFLNTGRSFNLARIIGTQVESAQGEMDLSRLLGFMNVRYVLVHNDTNWDLLEGHQWQFQHTPEKIRDFLNSQSGLTYHKSFGKLDIYKLDDKYFLPRIYGVRDYTLAIGETAAIETLLGRDVLDRSSVLVFSDDLGSEMFYKLLKDEARNSNLLILNASCDDIVLECVKNRGVLLNILGNREAKFKLAAAGEYEVWLKPAIGKESVLLDRMRLAPSPSIPQLNALWTKKGEVSLRPGRHEIFVFSDSERDATYRVAIIPKGVMLKWRSKISSMVDSNNIKCYVLARPSDEISSFYIPSSGNYRVAAKIKSVFVPMRDTYNVATTGVQALRRLRGPECDEQHLNCCFSIDGRCFGYADALSISNSKSSLFVDFGNVHFKCGEHFLRLGKHISLELQVSPSTADRISSTFQELEFKSINPTRYHVSVKRASEPFLLVFAESFSPDWEAYIESSDTQEDSKEGAVGGGTRHRLDRHLPVNGFANGWWIPVNGRLADGYEIKGGSLEVVLEYRPQRTLEVVFLVSGAVLVGCVAITIANRIPYGKRSG